MCFSLDKHAENKYSVTNFRPVSVVDTFSKIYEKVVKTFYSIRWNINFHHFFSAYQKSFSTEHVLIWILQDWSMAYYTTRPDMLHKEAEIKRPISHFK